MGIKTPCLRRYFLKNRRAHSIASATPNLSRLYWCLACPSLPINKYKKITDNGVTRRGNYMNHLRKLSYKYLFTVFLIFSFQRRDQIRNIQLSSIFKTLPRCYQHSKKEIFISHIGSIRNSNLAI